MSYDVGDLWAPELTVRDASGDLVAATVDLVITSPSGGVTTPVVTSAVTGVYVSSVLLIEPGLWQAKWTTSGAVTGVQGQSRYARVPGPEVISLPEVKTAFDIPLDDTDDDDRLQELIDAAVEVVTADLRPEFVPLASFAGPAVRVALVELVRDMWATGAPRQTSPEADATPVYGYGRPALPKWIRGLLKPYLKEAPGPTGDFPSPTLCWPDPSF
jgi:hypothetical protein